MRKPTITEAVIGAAAVIVAALISIYPSIRNQETKSVIAGIVVEQATNRGIGQATIVVAGRTEQYITEDSGNFRIEVRSQAPKRLRLHVSKAGFQPLDVSVEPEENLVLQLRKQ
jgi:hypothetical protein